jgi:hypothetical protein
MANELNITLSTGLTVTATTYLSGVVSTSGIACPEIGVTGVYQGNMIGLAGLYEVFFLSAGSIVGAGWISWDGAAEVSAAPVILTDPPPTGLDMVTSAMKIIGVLGQNETPTSSEAQDGLVALNDMLDSMSIDRSFIYTITQHNFPLVSGTSAYLIGNGGSINIDAPRKLDNVFIRINSVDYPLKEINNQDYDSIAYKLNGSFPQFYYYDAGFPYGTITIYGVPTQGTLYFDTWSPLTKFANLTTQYSFPLGYYRYLRYALAQELCPLYRVQLTAEAKAVLLEAQAAIKDRNLPDYVMKTEVGQMIGNRQYRTGY